MWIGISFLAVQTATSKFGSRRTFSRVHSLIKSYYEYYKIMILRSFRKCQFTLVKKLSKYRHF
jgi:hypothetical protein